MNGCDCQGEGCGFHSGVCGSIGEGIVLEVEMPIEETYLKHSSYLSEILEVVYIKLWSKCIRRDIKFSLY